MTDALILGITGFFTCTFLSGRLSDIFNVLFGAPFNMLSLILCAIMSIICVILACKSKVLDFFVGKRVLYVIAIIFGCIITYTAPNIFGAVSILEKLGAGCLLGTYILICATILSQLRLPRPHIDRNLCMFLLIVLAVVNFCGGIYVAQASTVYFWDSSTYWTISRDIANGNIPGGFFSSLYNSILHFDYNYLAGLLSAVFANLFGNSRTVYILSILNCYYVPIAATIYLLCKDTKRPIMVSSSILLAFPVILFLGLAGFVDIVGLLVCLACFKTYFSKNQTFAKAFSLGLLLALSILLRRWYAFFAVTFIFAMLCDVFISKRSFKYFLASLFHVGFILLMFFGELVTGKLLADYTTLYAGYKFALSTDFMLIFRYFGIIPLLLIAIGGIYAICKKDRRPWFLFIQMFSCFVLFVRTQTHGQQHLLLYIPALILLSIIVLEYANKKVIASVLILSIGISANTLINRPQPSSLTEIKSYAPFANFSMRPKTRPDTKQLLALKAYLDNLVVDGESVAVLSSSLVLNADILRNVEDSFGIIDKERLDYFISIPEVDSRDTDFSSLYSATYMVVATPAQTHLGAEKQRVVTTAVDSFVNNTDIAKSYELVDTSFKIDDIQISIYKRTQATTPDEINQFESGLFI